MENGCSNRKYDSRRRESPFILRISRGSLNVRLLLIVMIAIGLMVFAIMAGIFISRESQGDRPFVLTQRIGLESLPQHEREQWVDRQLTTALGQVAERKPIKWQVDRESIRVSGSADKETVKMLRMVLESIAVQAGRYYQKWSEDKLKQLQHMLFSYAGDNGDKFPDNLVQLRPYDTNGTLDWLMKNCTYLGAGKNLEDSLKTPLAYDRNLLSQGKHTVVLFLDKYIGLVEATELKQMGIIPWP